MLRDKRCLPYATCYTQTRQSSRSWRRHTKQHVSFINFKLLEIYWTYFLALQTTAPKVSPKRLMSLNHKLKMGWRTSGFVVILYKYGLLLKKPLAMSVREVWAVRFDSLLKPDPYCDDIMSYNPNWWKENVDHESTSWSKDLKGHVSPIHVVEWDMSLFGVLKRFNQKINNMLMWCGLPMK